MISKKKYKEINLIPKAKKSWADTLQDSKDFLRVVMHAWPKWVNARAPRSSSHSQTLEVDELMCKFSKGKLTTINHIRQHLAKKHGAAICCPLTSGLFSKIAAEATEEQKQQRKTNTTPYWRTLKKDGIINPKCLIGQEAQKQLLQNEGHTIIQKGKNLKVVDTKEHSRHYNTLPFYLHPTMMI